MSSKTGVDVVAVHSEIGALETLFRNAIIEKLDEDKDALKAFEVSFYQAKTVDEAKMLKDLGRRLIAINGALGLNDSGQNWRVFGVNIEEGLTDAQDREVADQLAFECLKCVTQMKREAGLSIQNNLKKVKRRAYG